MRGSRRSLGGRTPLRHPRAKSRASGTSPSPPLFRPSIGKSLCKFAKDLGIRLEPQSLLAQQALLDSARAQGRQCRFLPTSRMPARGGAEDTLEAAAWATAGWRKRGWTPQGLREHGASWLLARTPGSCCCFANQWSLLGTGMVLQVTQGPVYFVVFPLRCIREARASLTEGTEWLLSLAYKPFRDSAESEFGGAFLDRGACAWVRRVAPGGSGVPAVSPTGGGGRAGSLSSKRAWTCKLPKERWAVHNWSIHNK